MAMLGTLAKLAAVVVVVAVLWRWYEQSRRLPPVWGGHFKPEYQPVADLFRQLVSEGTEQGGSFAVYSRGERLLELWGGYADPESKRPWREDTITQVFSVTKGLTATAAAKLVEKGHLDYKKEVREYWPEFAQNGKANVTVEMLLSHQAGLATLGGATMDIMEYKNDWKKVEKILAAAAPENPPGTTVGYHAISFAMYVDALIRRADPKHRNLTQFFSEEIAKPFDIDFYIGLPLEQAWRMTRAQFMRTRDLLPLLLDSKHRAATLEFMDSSSFFVKAVNWFTGFNDEYLNDPIRQNVGVGSMNGFGAAGSLAKLYDYLANGGQIADKRLLPQHIVDKFSKPITGSLRSMHNTFAPQISLGFFVSSDRGVRFGHPGYGGQQANADPQNKLGIAYVTNFHQPELITPPKSYIQLENAFYECFEKQQA